MKTVSVFPFFPRVRLSLVYQTVEVAVFGLLDGDVGDVDGVLLQVAGKPGQVHRVVEVPVAAVVCHGWWFHVLVLLVRFFSFSVFSWLHVYT